MNIDKDKLIKLIDDNLDVVCTDEEMEDSLINTYHEQVKDFINSRKKKISL